jgi:hypothetical protein
LVQNIYDCDFSSKISKQYLKFISSFKHYDSYVTRSKYVWTNCFSHDRKHFNCYDSTYQRDKCLNAQVRFIKTVRLRGTRIEKLLKENVNLKIIILMRDPRGIMKSRTDHDWCGKKRHCNNVTELCQQMELDLATAVSLNKIFPGQRITLVSFLESQVDCINIYICSTKLRSQRINFN